MPRVTEEYRASRRDEIADAALAAFRRRGFQATSMAEIITEAGLSAGAIYGHYPSKNALVLDVASRIVSARVADIAALADQDPLVAPGSVPRILMEDLDASFGGPEIMLQVWGEAITDHEIRTLAVELVNRLQAALRAYVAHWYRSEHDLDDPAADAVAAEIVPLLVGVVQGYVVQRSIVPTFDPDAYFRAAERHLPR